MLCHKSGLPAKADPLFYSAVGGSARLTPYPLLPYPAAHLTGRHIPRRRPAMYSDSHPKHRKTARQQKLPSPSETAAANQDAKVMVSTISTRVRMIMKPEQATRNALRDLRSLMLREEKPINRQPSSPASRSMIIRSCAPLSAAAGQGRARGGR